MTKLEKLQNSNIWDNKYNLPTSPQNNNPWVYMACCQKLIYPEVLDPSSLTKYYAGCINNDFSLNRWPNSNSEISQDELIGSSYLFVNSAEFDLLYMKYHNGFYSNTGPKKFYQLQYWYYRFPWFISYLKSRANKKLNLFNKITWSLFLLLDILTTKKDSSTNKLLIYLMMDEMNKYYICNKVIKYWKYKMKSIGYTPKLMFSIEPKENPILSEISTEEF